MSYRDLKTYQQATVIYDFTVEFTSRYIKSFRTKDQMDQAGRSGKQNISEGCEVSRTSKSSELKLLGVALGSLKELGEDYEDYLRQHNLTIWQKESVEAYKVRNFVYGSTLKELYWPYLEKPELAANAMICLINQTTYLLKNQINSLEEKFAKEGGYHEKLYKLRTKL
ncbi:MAG: hypothetical protein ACD_22C00167G0002 [uncultured bacterium]|nr:MAG: hypothetical protein ACD_22C00167G0002 [uncultured bacterium]